MEAELPFDLATVVVSLIVGLGAGVLSAWVTQWDQSKRLRMEIAERDKQRRRNEVEDWRAMVRAVEGYARGNPEEARRQLQKWERFFSLLSHLDPDTRDFVARGGRMERDVVLRAGVTMTEPLGLILQEIDRIEKGWDLR